MMRRIVKKRQLIDWKTRNVFMVSRIIVEEFARMRPSLKFFKMSHIDPLRSKQTTENVCSSVLNVSD